MRGRHQGRALAETDFETDSAILPQFRAQPIQFPRLGVDMGANFLETQGALRSFTLSLCYTVLTVPYRERKHCFTLLEHGEGP